MSTATRTAAEAARSKCLADRAGMRKAYTHTIANLYKLDLTCLPVETYFKLAVIDVSTPPPTIEEDMGMVAAELEIRTSDGTLRQLVYDRATVTSGLSAYAKMLDDKGKKRSFTVSFDGTNAMMRERYDSYNGKPTFDHTNFRTDLTRRPYERAFIPQHTLRFPATFHGRADVSFLGLPTGTILPLKNGGKFEVICRTNVTVEADGSANGHLFAKPLDDKAEKLATLMGYGMEKIGGVVGYLIPPNLYTDKSNGRSFDTANIRLPYADPTVGMPNFFEHGIAHSVDMESGVVVRIPRTAGSEWATSSEELAEQLDDFLFG